MQIEERWEQLSQLLSIDNKDRTRLQAEDLRVHLKALLQSSDGRRSVAERLQSKTNFPGREKFLRELASGLDEFRPPATDSGAGERIEIIRSAISRTSGKKKEGHFDLLWLLIESGDSTAAETSFNSLTKISTKKLTDLKSILAGQESWMNIRPERGVAILEAARKSVNTPEALKHLEQALEWQKGKIDWHKNFESKTSNDLTSGKASATPAEPIAPQEPSTASTPATNERDDEYKSATDKVASSERSSDEPNRVLEPPCEKPISDTLSAPIPSDRLNRESLEACLSEVSRVIAAHFNQYVNQIVSVPEIGRRAEADADSIRQPNAQLSAELAMVCDQLKGEQEVSRKTLERVAYLETSLSKRTDEITTKQKEIEKLQDELTSVQKELEKAYKMADDEIHQIKIERDHALRTFQSDLWNRLRPCLAEILDEASLDGSISSEQLFFRRRLLEIRDLLREMQVPPY